jgi:hypothetical protein
MSVSSSGTIVDLPDQSLNFPPAPSPEIIRDYVVNTLRSLLQDDIYATAIEGAEGIGKTTVLAQFARKHPTTAVSLFISASNRMSYDPDLIRLDIATQVYCAATGSVLDRSNFDPALLKSYYLELQYKAKLTKSLIYFIIDGIDELESAHRPSVIQYLSDILPLGIPQFRFLFSGDERLYKTLTGPRLILKAFPLTEFSVEEARALLGEFDLPPEAAAELNIICRGMPGRLTGVLRALRKGITVADFIRDAPTRWPEFFEIDWNQVSHDDNNLERILALLAHDSKPYTVAGIASILNITEEEVCQRLSSVNFIVVDQGTNNVRFVTSGLRNYAADRLKARKAHIQKLLIKRLLSVPHSDESILDLPAHLEEASEYSDLLGLLTPEHIIEVLERSQTLSRVDDTVKRGFRGAKKLGRDADMLRFCLQQSIISDLASANVWESEVAALAALNRDSEALALANNAVLREDRLQMLATLAHNIWIRGRSVPPELLDQIRLLIDNLDYWSLGRRAGKIASNLTCVSPELATVLLRKSKWVTDDEHLDRAFARFTLAALHDVKDETRRAQALDAVVRSRPATKTSGLLEAIRVMAGSLKPKEVCARSMKIDDAETRLSVLRYWCVMNGHLPDADLVAIHAIDFALATTAIRLDADLLADISRALSGTADVARRKALIARLDGIRATAERLGPSVDFVRLQLAIASSELTFDPAATEGRLTSVLGYISSIGDLAAKGDSYAQSLAALRLMSKISALLWIGETELRVTEQLDGVLLLLSEGTADHYRALGGIIARLAVGDLPKALEYTKLVNTEERRDAVLGDVVEALLERPIPMRNVQELVNTHHAIVSRNDRDNALYAIMKGYAAESNIPEAQISALLPLVSDLPEIADSLQACRALVRAVIVLSNAGDHASLRSHLLEHLKRRWRQMDCGWLRIDAGYGIVRDLSSFDLAEVQEILQETEALKSEWSLAAPAGIVTYIASLRLLIRLFCGLLPRHLESDADIKALSAMIDVLPSCGERAALWSDLSMRASLIRRTDVCDKVVEQYVAPALAQIPKADAAYRSAVLIRVSPALYESQRTTCMESLAALDPDDRDLALYQIIRFLLTRRVPLDPVDAGALANVETTYDLLLQVVDLTSRLKTDWMIYVTARDVSEVLHSPKNRFSVARPQREDIGARFGDIARRTLPIARHIAHPGYRIATLAHALRIGHVRSAEWANLVREAEGLDNLADRVYVMQIIALALPTGMRDEKDRLLESVRILIEDIPWQLDQIERFVGLAEDLQGTDTILCREILNQAAQAIALTKEDTNEQRRRLVDIAYRVDEDFAKQLIDAFDDDDAKKVARAQVRLLEIRRRVAESESNKADQERMLREIQGTEIAKLGVGLQRALSASRVQSYHPSDIRDYLDVAAQHPLRRSFPLLMWYIENANTRYAGTDQAVTFLRPMFDACIIGAQLAGQISGRSLIRLRALKHMSGEISNARAFMATAGSREEAIQVVVSWLEKRVWEELKFHDPYFGPGDLMWVQSVRSAKPNCSLTIITSKRHQPALQNGEELDEIYANAWRRQFDQAPPKVEIVVIGGEKSKDSPIHDRWLVTRDSGLRFGGSLNSLGVTKTTDISEMTPEEVEQKSLELEQYLVREKTDHNGEKLRLSRFWL